MFYDERRLIERNRNPIEKPILILHKGRCYFIYVLTQFLISLCLLVLLQFLGDFEQPFVKVIEDGKIVRVVFFLFDFVFE